jgi:adenosylcobinamide amidohydrolase
MLTSRDIRFHHFDTAVVGHTEAEALVTLGLSNAERIGHRRLACPEEYGTINIAARLNQCLSETAMIEALTIMAEARTAAVMEARYEVMVSGAPVIATGTGTDCLTLACVQGEDRHHAHAGLHTEIGHALGRVVYDAVRTACDTYLSEEATA